MLVRQGLLESARAEQLDLLDYKGLLELVLKAQQAPQAQWAQLELELKVLLDQPGLQGLEQLVLQVESEQLE